MSVRQRLLLAAAVIVGVSVLLSGALSWLLVSNLETENARLDLDRLAITTRQLVLRQQCNVVPAPGGTGCGTAKPVYAPREVFLDRLRGVSVGPAADRLLLVDASGGIVYDSVQPGEVGTRIVLTRTRTVDSQAIREGDVVLAGEPYIGGAVALGRDPQLGSRFLVLARRSQTVTEATAATLLPRLLLAGGVALLVAFAVALLLSRAFVRPLTELAGAAEDIAAGNYGRRVTRLGADEISIVGHSFNRMAEAVERARTQQRDFLANVSHELKTPLTSLIGFSQALRDGTLRDDQERARAIAIIHEEAERVLRMSQELLDLARVEAGQISIHPAAVDLKAMLEQGIEVVRHRAQARRVELDLVAADGLAPVRADPERLHQLLDNLFDNAVKYAPEGSRVEVRVGTEAAGAEVTVSNLVGDHPPDPDRMFERFYRADPARSAARGVGLGLAISRELATAMGCRLWAEMEGDLLRLRLALPAGGPPLSS